MPDSKFTIKKATGFTMVEATVIFALIAIIAGSILVRFPALHERIALQRSTQDLALTLRRAQSMALAVRRVSDLSGVVVTPKGFGVQVSLGPSGAASTTYFMFADLNGDRLYRESDDVNIEAPMQVLARISIIDLESNIEITPRNEQVVNVVFKVPEGTTFLSNNSSSVSSPSHVILRSAIAALAKSVIIRTSGQISTQ